MNYRIVHRTTYEYAAPVAVSHHVARLEPRATAAQTPENFLLKILPHPVLRKVRDDYFGNQLCFFSVQENHQRLEITATSRVSIKPQPPSDSEASPSWEEVAQLFRDPVAPEVIVPYQFVFDSPQVRASMELAAYARESFPKGMPLLAGALDLTRRIFKDFKYDSKATTIITPIEEVMENRRGVCQDFAHLSIACLRSLGLSARYVSGYLRTRPPEGKEKLIGADASHAWFSIFCPRTGWNDFDPTNNARVSEEHITDVSPVAGILTGGGNHEVKVSVDVEEIPAA
jgi:transglutaminase-like putative cysteine protease